MVADMPTSYLDQFFIMDPSAPPAFGTSLAVVKYTLIDQNNDNDFDRFNNDSVNGSDIRQSYPGDTVTVNVPGVGNVTYTGITFYLASGQVVFTPNDGQALEDGTFVTSTFVNSQGPLLVSQLGPPCFAAGTRIATVRGEVAVEDLRVGDLVQTMDSGLQPIRWMGGRAMRGTGDFAPIRFKAGRGGQCARSGGFADAPHPGARLAGRAVFWRYRGAGAGEASGGWRSGGD